MFVRERFAVNDRTEGMIRNLTPKFGYDGFGELIFYRTYSREKLDGGQENWADCVLRVTNGTFSIRKDHYIKNHIHWDEAYWQDYAYKFAKSMFEMWWLPPGRGLWAMGTPFIYERGSMALYNCAFTLLGNDFADDIAWLMDALMHGVGVGFEAKRDDGLTLYEPKGSYDYIIPDTREGWTESVKAKINSYRYPFCKKPRFIYDRLRAAGTKINGFGGIASGPAPLKWYHEKIEQYCQYFLGDMANYDSLMLKTDLANGAGCTVCAGNLRRSAELSAGKITDQTFLDLKDYEKHPYREEIGWMSNNSVLLEEDSDFERMGEISKRVIKNGEPGYINKQNLKYARIGKKMKGLRKDKAIGFNPCITGETKILLADGRGYQRIDSLINTDPLVYAVDENDRLVVRQMRNVRKTGEQQKILKIVFDDGNYVRVTENHRIMLRDRSFVQAQHLEVGQSVALVNRYIPKYCDKTNYSRNNQYISLGFGGKTVNEHSLIGEYSYGKLERNEHFHHIDENKLNNEPSNIEKRLANEHLSEHSKGEENARFSGLTRQDILNLGIGLAQKLGRRFSRNEWEAEKILNLTSSYRKEQFGSFFEFAYLCADMAEVQNDKVDPRTLRYYQEMIEQGYDCVIEYSDHFKRNSVKVCKICEGCYNEFWIEAQQREHACCSLSCNNRIRDYTKNTETNRKINAAKKESLREKQLDIYTRLKVVLGRQPKKEEWVQGCKDAGISAEISRASSPFRSWDELKWKSRDHNHRIVGIYEDGYEDVYNGTVDEYHNFVIGGWEEETAKGRIVERGIVNPQCGEIPLEHRETCNVVETYPTVCDCPEKWYKACEYANFYAQTVSLLPTHQASTNRVIARNHRIGVSIVDFTGWKHDIGLNQVIKHLRHGYKVIRKNNKELAAEAGVPESIRVTTVKPGGTTPKLPGKTPGIGHPTFRETLRRIRVQQDVPFNKVLRNADIPHEPDYYSMNTDVFSYPIIQGPADPAEEVSLWEQAMNLVTVQREWSDNAVSNTLYFRPKWRLLKSFDKLDNDTLNYIEGTTLDIQQFNRIERWLETATNKEEYHLGDYKVAVFRRKDFEIKNICVYQYDPKHEEDYIEAVLSHIAPLSKSVTLLPHSAKGAYVQMPEEGISREEYEELRAKIKPIDWKSYSGSDGIDEKYCEGPRCEIPLPV